VALGPRVADELPSVGLLPGAQAAAAAWAYGARHGRPHQRRVAARLVLGTCVRHCVHTKSILHCRAARRPSKIRRAPPHSPMSLSQGKVSSVIQYCRNKWIMRASSTASRVAHTLRRTFSTEVRLRTHPACKARPRLTADSSHCSLRRRPSRRRRYTTCTLSSAERCVRRARGAAPCSALHPHSPPPHTHKTLNRHISFLPLPPPCRWCPLRGTPCPCSTPKAC